MADEQTAGRGRSARDWWTGPRGTNLAITLAVDPAPPPAPLCVVIAACALAHALTERGAQAAAVKWPNDVLLGGAKVAGVIGEWRSGPPPSALLGMGVNVAASPPHSTTRAPATSVNAALATRGLAPLDRLVLLADWLIGFELRWQRALRGDVSALEEEFLNYLRAWAPRGVREPATPSEPGGRLLEFRFDSGLTWQSGDRTIRRSLAALAALEALP